MVVGYLQKMLIDIPVPARVGDHWSLLLLQRLCHHWNTGSKNLFYRMFYNLVMKNIEIIVITHKISELEVPKFKHSNHRLTIPSSGACSKRSAVTGTVVTQTNISRGKKMIMPLFQGFLVDKIRECQKIQISSLK